MKTSPTSSAALRVDAARSADAAVRREPVKAIMPALVTGMSAVAILLGASVLAELVILPLSLGLVAVIEAFRCAVAPDALGFALHVAERVEPLLRLSVWGALALGTLACAAFMADLRRQRWL